MSYETASVLIPAYNAGNYIAKAIRSVLAQSVAPLEIIVASDGSTDDTVTVARELGAVVLDLPRGNGAIARNEAAKVATGDILFFLDADDWWHEDKIKEHMARWNQVPSASLMMDRMQAVYETGSVAYWMGGIDRDGAVEWNELLSHRSWVSGSGFSVPKEKYWAIGGFNEKLLKWQDVDFWVRLTYQQGNAEMISKSLTNYLLVTGSVGKSTANLEKNIQNLFESWQFLPEQAKTKFAKFAYLSAAEFTPFPKSLPLLARAGFQAGNRYYWKCVLSSIRRGFESVGKGRVSA